MKKIVNIRNTKAFKANQALLKAYESELAELKDAIKELKQEQVTLLSKQELECPTCSKRHKIGSLLLINGALYVKSYSAYEDSYWKGTQKSYVVCPSCESILELDKGWVDEHKDSFMSCKNGRLELRKDDQFLTYLSIIMPSKDRYGYDEVRLTTKDIIKAVKGDVRKL